MRDRQAERVVSKRGADMLGYGLLGDPEHVADFLVRVAVYETEKEAVQLTLGEGL